MRPQSKADHGWHVVLGGSSGIGLAYATHRARAGGRVMIVARERKRLQAAAEALTAVGAGDVRVVQQDVLELERLPSLLEETGRVESLLVNGPSPPAGPCESLTPAGMELGSRVCLLYPLTVLRWAMSSAQPPRLVIVVSSHSAKEPVHRHEFFVSALLRRSLDVVIQELRPHLDKRGSRCEVWHPSVVLTPLSEGYGERLVSHGGTSVIERLREHFGVASVPTADEYVREKLAPVEQPGGI